MRLFHTTTRANADSIMAVGFRDHATESYYSPHPPHCFRSQARLINKGSEKVLVYPPGVWLSDVPSIAPFEGFKSNVQAVIAVDVCLHLRGIRRSKVDTSWPGTQYWGPAAIWNRFPRVRLHIDDVIRLRVSAMPALAVLALWTDECNRDRMDDDHEFHVRFERILRERVMAAGA